MGVKGSSGEYIVVDATGVWKTRTLRRRPEEERWDKKNLEMAGGVPWRTSGTDKNTDGEALRMDVPEAVRMAPEEEEKVAEKEDLVVPRNLYLKKADFEKHGYSKDCRGCKSLLRGTARLPQSVACRKRVTQALAGDEDGDERVKRADARIN